MIYPVLILSDSHCLPKLIKDVIKKEKPSTILHLGDLTGENNEKYDQEALYEWLERNKKHKLILINGRDDSHGPLEMLIQSRKGCYSGKEYINEKIIASHEPSDLPLDNLKHGMIAFYGHAHVQAIDFFIENDEKITKTTSRMHVWINSNPIVLGNHIYIANPGYFQQREYAILNENKLNFYKD